MHKLKTYLDSLDHDDITLDTLHEMASELTDYETAHGNKRSSYQQLTSELPSGVFEAPLGVYAFSTDGAWSLTCMEGDWCVLDTDDVRDSTG